MKSEVSYCLKAAGKQYLATDSTFDQVLDLIQKEHGDVDVAGKVVSEAEFESLMRVTKESAGADGRSTRSPRGVMDASIEGAA